MFGKRAFNDRLVRVHPKYNQICPRLQVMNNGALTLKTYDAGVDHFMGARAGDALRLARSINQRASVDSFDAHDCVMMQVRTKAKQSNI